MPDNSNFGGSYAPVEICAFSGDWKWARSNGSIVAPEIAEGFLSAGTKFETHVTDGEIKS